MKHLFMIILLTVSVSTHAEIKHFAANQKQAESEQLLKRKESNVNIC